MFLLLAIMVGLLNTLVTLFKFTSFGFVLMTSIDVLVILNKDIYMIWKDQACLKFSPCKKALIYLKMRLHL
jgi:hypothetical protein